MEISKNVLFRVLDEMGVARLALETITGRVDAMPIVFARVNDRIVSPIDCLLYTSPSPRDRTRSRMPSSA